MIKKIHLILIILLSFAFTKEIGYVIPFKKSDFIRIHKYCGLKKYPILQEPKLYKGIVFELKDRSKIYSINDGKVVSTYESDKGMLGTFVKIKHNDSIIATYYHLKNVNISKGSLVKKGQHIASSGNSGMTTINGLGIMIELNGDIVNPNEIIGITEYNK